MQKLCSCTDTDVATEASVYSHRRSERDHAALSSCLEHSCSVLLQAQMTDILHLNPNKFE